MAGHDQDKTNKAVKKLQKSYFDVLGLCCSSEIPLIENLLRPLDGVKEVTVIVATRTVIVVHDSLLISQIQIVKALNQARLEANVKVHGEENMKKKWPSPYAIASGVLLMLSFLKYVFRPLGWLALGAVAIGIIPVCLKALAAVRNLRLDINILVIVAVIGTIAMNDYLEAGTIVFLFTIAEWLETRASHKANAVMSSLMSMAPQKAVIAETGEVVDVDEVKLNTVLAVKAGEAIPIDGIVVDGKCEVDEKTLTGESFPVAKQKDSSVWAGTINLNGYVSVKTTALAEDCAVTKMAKLVEEAQNGKSRTQRFIDKCAKFYTPGVLIISISLAVIPAALRVHNQNMWFHLALVVLVSACPCALILSTPVATFCALTNAATSGLLIKGGDYLEILGKTKIVAFDKTGTITRGEFFVTNFQSLRDDIGLNTLLYWVSSIESKSSHPMAAALVDYGRSRSIEPKPEIVEEFHNFPGEGIHGKLEGNDIYIGNKKIAARASCEIVPTLEGYAKEGKTVGYIYSGGNPVGIFTLSDACRSGVIEAINELKSLGIKTAMLTGDSHAAAMQTHGQLGQALEVVRAELLPEDKVKIIKGFKKEGTTAMVGDGINDAPALAIADIGISMGISGSALATETGHVILLSNDIRKIPKAIRLSRRTIRKVVQNVILSITTKVAILALAIAGHPLVWAAVLADVGTCLLVIFNSMLLLTETHKHGGKCCKSSSAPHVHKHGCNESHHSHLHHKHQHCSSNSKAPKVCEHKKCSSHTKESKCCEPKRCSSHTKESKCQASTDGARSCSDNECLDLADMHDACVDNNALHNAKHCHHHGISNMLNHDLESQDTHDRSCSSPQNVSSCMEGDCVKTGREGDFVGGDGCHDAEQCDHSSSLVQYNKVVNTSGHCHSIHCGKTHKNNKEPGKTVVSSCVHKHQNIEVDSCMKKCGGDHTTIDIDRGSESSDHSEPVAVEGCVHLEKRDLDLCCGRNVCTRSNDIHACKSLEKREMGGCCKSYMEECCKHGNFGAAFGGGLSEIITE
ncbi:hypothetical protein FEM48_Zijuj01G0013800 [Ziziphus jujuba var. spinosa]|uniref:HMA domain-containing protein n=1 Tax=Ziziphus jujuba var. spinosa TaxID=714518 RepID=A0A978VYB9_ZIZJJ|nr:hypothetical protein FEM48_Zijuj01G0013800 [Ziziphus jujuba var. spinosa]